MYICMQIQMIVFYISKQTTELKKTSMRLGYVKSES